MKQSTQYIRQQHISAGGFTLLELSIVMVISGIIMAILFSGASIYFERIRTEKLARLEKNVYSVMDQLVQRLGRYPCPARRDAFGDGGENCGALNTVGGARAVFLDPANDRVAVGVLPDYVCIAAGCANRLYLKDLIPKDEPLQTDFIDPWGNRLSYAVTVGLTNAGTFDDNGGTVAVTDENGRPTNGINNNAHYVVISHGSDEGGAVTQSGVISPAACGQTPSGVVAPLEDQNCAPGDQTTAPFVAGLISRDDTSGATYYNDYVFSSRYFQSDLWISRSDMGASPPRTNLTTVQRSRVGIGLTNPAEVLDVGTGTVRADRALVLGGPPDGFSADPDATGLLCTTVAGGESCLNPLSLFNLRCPDSGTFQYMRGTEMGAPGAHLIKAVCANFGVTLPAPDPGKKWQVSCPDPGSLVKGIYSDGRILCTGSMGIISPGQVPGP